MAALRGFPAGRRHGTRVRVCPVCWIQTSTCCSMPAGRLGSLGPMVAVGVGTTPETKDHMMSPVDGKRAQYAF